jgi:ribosomal-protein-alanine N-acetyltransferase
VSSLFPRELRAERILLRAPRAEDAAVIFARYASDAQVTRFLCWPSHRSVDDTRAFLSVAMRQWNEGTGFAFLIESRDGARLIGSVGLTMNEPHCATTGYALASDAWGHGFATEALCALMKNAFEAPFLMRVQALCHTAHAASENVLEKSGFVREGILRRHTVFPNFDPNEPQDVALWARVRGKRH